ncbi:unnamed protein product, partial [Pocillopora meandrina]
NLASEARNLYQFGLMIWCATSRSPWDYYDYGCWCGYGGSGTPVDDTDRCCQIHDSCYDVLVNNSICSTWWKPYFLNYLFTPCHKCDPESSYPSDEVDVTCKRALCECDSQATKCFANSTFNAANIDYDTSKTKPFRETKPGFLINTSRLLSFKFTARNLYQFGNMVNCMTNRSRFDYADYGCWCGAGGSGKPVDHVDKCCQIHDKCYDVAMVEKCYFYFHVYSVVYRYQGCRQCDPISSYPSWEDKVDVECKKAVCDCDSDAALCFSQSVYNSSLYNYDTSKC